MTMPERVFCIVGKRFLSSEGCSSRQEKSLIRGREWVCNKACKHCRVSSPQIKKYVKPSAKRICPKCFSEDGVIHKFKLRGGYYPKRCRKHQYSDALDLALLKFGTAW